jgi:hypothetical protein
MPLGVPEVMGQPVGDKGDFGPAVMIIRQNYLFLTAQPGNDSMSGDAVDQLLDIPGYPNDLVCAQRDRRHGGPQRHSLSPDT